MTPRERVTERVTRNGHPDAAGTPAPLLTLPEFFDGNTVVGSIGCNLPSVPSPAEFRAVLEAVLLRATVLDVRVQVTMFDDPDWPFSDTVWVITSASAAAVRGWFPENFAPEEVWQGWREGVLYEPYDLPEGTRPVGCWWD